LASQLRHVTPTAVEFRALPRISPSLGERLLSCELSVAFRLDPQYAFLRRPAPASALGNISHDLAEAVARGDFDSVPPDEIQDALETAWSQALVTAELELSVAHPAGAVPPAQRWPGFAQTHVRMLDLLIAEVAGRRKSSHEDRFAPSLEEPLEPVGIPLHGRPDRVERNGSRVDLVDLKTGWTLPDELKSSHRRQLLAYAFLWHAVHGEWPRTASIQRLDGERLTFDVVPSEAEEVATELVHALEVFNSHVKTTTSGESIATPSPGACQYCAYRAACKPFFRAINSEWSSYRKSVSGRVTSITLGRDTNRVEITVDRGNVDTPKVNLVNVPDSLTPPKQVMIAVVDASPTRTESDLRLAWDTVVCVWE
jgi:hypothetical protein